MTVQEIQEEVKKSKLDKVCMFAFNELANFIDWTAESKEINEHYQNNLLL